MGKRLFAAFVFWLAGAAAAQPSLTEAEARWLKLSWPAVTYALEQGLPLDIVVQPQPTPGNAPLAMAFIGGRCKLVLSMRGNPAAQSSLEVIPPELLHPVVEAMAAHELGHCWRYVRGAWHTLPAGFATVSREAAPADPTLGQRLSEMQQTRLEEGFADLVGLAWTFERHPQHYAQVHAWLTQYRRDDTLPGSHHDTLAWVQLAAEPAAFKSGGSLFEQAWPLWQQGLRSGE